MTYFSNDAILVIQFASNPPILRSKANIRISA